MNGQGVPKYNACEMVPDPCRSPLIYKKVGNSNLNLMGTAGILNTL